MVIGLTALSSVSVTLAFLYLWRKRLRSLLGLALAAGFTNSAILTLSMLLYDRQGANHVGRPLEGFIVFDVAALVSVPAALLTCLLLWCCAKRSASRANEKGL